MTYDVALTALADPTRRAVFEALHTQPRSVAELANLLPVSRPAVSQHLRVLADAGLVTSTPKGTRRIYTSTPDGLRALQTYLEGFWTDALGAYAAEVARRTTQ